MKTALVTGASRGIGRATAAAFKDAGYRVITTCSADCDCRDYAAVGRLFESIDRLDVLVNNAGIDYSGLLQDMTVEEWDRVIQTDLSSVFYTCRYAIPLMLNRGSGHIINISSIWGEVGASMEVAYSAAKSGVNGLTRALAKELAPSSISVNAVSPGAIDTDMNTRLSADELAALIDEIPMNRLGTAQEVAQVILMLAESPVYLTGQIIRVAGAW